MTEQEAQNYAINTYNSNIQYIQNNHPELFQKLSLYNTAIDLQEVKVNFDLQFKDGYFDIVNLSNNQLLYGNNSLDTSKTLIEGANTNIENSSFKAFYDYPINEEDAKDALNKGILSRYIVGNAPIINFVNKNLPSPQVLNSMYKYIIFGVGLGLHIPLLHERFKCLQYLIVEPNLEIFRLSLFVTNYAELAKNTNLTLSIAEDEISFRKSFEDFYLNSFIYNHYFKFFQLSNNFSLYTKTIQNYLVSQSFLLFSYNRSFLSLYRTHSYIMQDYKFLDISKIQNLISLQKPVILLAAGPSLQKNIDFVKKNQDKFIIVAIYATLPLLEENGIKPNIVTQYDEQDGPVLNTLLKVKDLSFFKETLFIFASQVNAKLSSAFNKNNIYFVQAMLELKKGFGKITSPSIGELTYGLLLKLGAKEIYLLGLDLALDNETGKSHIDGHSGANAFSSLQGEEESSDTSYSYRKNTITVKGNFSETVKTAPVFKTNIDCFTIFTEDLKTEDVKVFNLSDGAYLYGASPLKIEDIKDLSKLEISSKNIQEDLNSISGTSYTQEDLEEINLKISSAKKLKKALSQFLKIKTYKKFKTYENNLLHTLQQLIFENKADDLRLIITNFAQHNITHIFHLFSTNTEKKNLSFIPQLNKIIGIQFNKIIDTYIVSILYSKDENNNLTKKLNKLIKEYKIDKTIYCDPQFKELSETALWGELQTVGKNSIALFAINENLENKNFISYIKDIVRTYNCRVKVLYIFENQKNKASQIFRDIKDNLDYILPNNLEEVAKEIEVYMDSSNHSSLEKINDILLNNYVNILCISFDEKTYLENKKLVEIENIDISLKEKLLQNKLPNSSYYSFAQSLNNIDEDKLLELHKKEHIGFFGFTDNLTKEFVENIYEIAERFPNLRFSCFYFTEKQKKKFEKVFILLLNRFDFIIPNDIYDIANNTEVWVQAKIKGQSFLFNKVLYIFTTNTIYNAILDNNFNIKVNTTNYLESLDEEYKKIKFIKNLNLLTKEENGNIDHSPNCIGFIATNENLEDKDFLNYIRVLKRKLDNTVIFKAFYFDKKQKKQLELVFLENSIEYYSLEKLSDLTNKLEILITNSHTYLDQIIYNKLESKLEEMLMINYTNNKFNLDDFDKKIVNPKKFISFIVKSTSLEKIDLSQIDNTQTNPYKIQFELNSFLKDSVEIDDTKYSENFYEFVYFDLIKNILKSTTTKRLYLNQKKYRDK